MKRHGIPLCLTLTLACLGFMLGAVSCTSTGGVSKLPDLPSLEKVFTPENKAKLAQWGNTALFVGQLTGYINPKQAEAIQKVGALVLKQDGKTDTAVITASQLLVAKLVEDGKLTQEQADQLVQLGTVPVEPTPPGPVNTLLPPVPSE